MPSKKKYNARFPAGRIKKIMQTDDEVGKVAQAVPIIISRTLELFVESLIKKTMEITMMKNARTLSPHHMKQCILSESRFDFLRDLVKSVPEGAASDDDVGSISDNSSSVQQTRRRDSKDVEMKDNVEQTPLTPGLNFYRETQISTYDNPKDMSLKTTKDSSDSDSDD